ncbi:class I SAM-dependent methyltransferase [Amycolatopsis jiangsuensis]|uniref:SAM-dependent methyltransferase n=1 Tax=Amycolatopsis jiangsuensis TaxID=1181879 RepID=A0A840IT82_9PSEU|nr:class I SAM-dependent methyltransferase [Amycolatopsis jiangsuensis]MBB4684422.1 SAM-dependent methyltransferase [Amycolatopsis jiangsuensis]
MAMDMDAEFYSRVADRFGGYFSDARSTDVFVDGRPEDLFDEWVIALGGARARLLDVGCADGRSLLRTSLVYEAVKGIDLSSSMLESAVRNRDAVSASNVTFELCDAAETGFPDDHLDVVTSRRGPLFLDEFKRVLRPGGTLVYMGIGEQDARELKEEFERGQNFGSWNDGPLAGEVARDMSKSGFLVTKKREFRFEEFYHSAGDLDTFLHAVPILDDYDSMADKSAFDRYVAAAAEAAGVRLSRHWFIVQAQKPMTAGTSHS